MASLLRRFHGDDAARPPAARLADTAAVPIVRLPKESPAPAPLPGPVERPVPGEVPVPAGAVPAPAAAALPGLDMPPFDVSVAGRGARRDRRPARVRSRATIRHLDIFTVIRVSVIFWTVVLVAVVVASLLLWTAADAFGSLPSIEKSVRTLFSLKSFTLHPANVAEYTALGGLVIAVAGTLATVICALIYNLIADVVGGVRVELESFNNRN